jgi:hypothetical protein
MEMQRTIHNSIINVITVIIVAVIIIIPDVHGGVNGL